MPAASEKLRHEAVGYEHPARGSNHCSECKHYLGRACEIVRDPIRPEDWCRRFMLALEKEKVRPMAQNWIQGAIKKPGSLRNAAKRSGMSTAAYARKHKGDAGKTGKRARLALTLMKMHH